MSQQVFTAEDFQQQLDSLTNSYYVMMESADFILSELQRFLEVAGRDLKFDIKKRHNIMMSHVTALRNTQTKFTTDYQCFGEQELVKYTSLITSASYICRIVLLIGDRINSCPEVQDHIEEFIKNLPTQGLIDQRIVDNFKTK